MLVWLPNQTPRADKQLKITVVHNAHIVPDLEK